MKKTATKKPVVKPVVKALVVKPVVKTQVAKAQAATAQAATALAKPVVKAPVRPAVKAKKVITPPRPLPARSGKKSVKPDATAKPATIDADAPRIECRLLVGDLAVMVDAADLNHTLGTGAYGNFDSRCPGIGSGLVDAWPDAAWVGLLAHLGLPADPLDRRAAALPVKRLVQRLWYEAIKGGVPDEVTLRKRDADYAAEYEEKEFVEVKESAIARSETAKVTFAKVRAARCDSPRSGGLSGKVIKVLNKNHGARPGSKRCIGLDLILKAKTTDEVLPQLTAAGCNGSFITFAVVQGFIELI